MKDTPSILSRVPETVFLLLGVSRSHASFAGMTGCGLQLGIVDYDWKETTISFDMGNAHVRVFLKTKEESYDIRPGSPAYRMPLLLAEEYFRSYRDIDEFLSNYKRNRFIRLGQKAFLDPWELDTRDAFILCAPDLEFDEYFIKDPRGPPLISEVSSRTGRISPKQFRDWPGLPDPGVGGWR